MVKDFLLTKPGPDGQTEGPADTRVAYTHTDVHTLSISWVVCMTNGPTLWQTKAKCCRLRLPTGDG